MPKKENKNELKKKERELLLAKIDALDDCISKLEVTANSLYCCFEKDGTRGWNKLLKMRDELNTFKELHYAKLYKLEENG